MTRAFRPWGGSPQGIQGGLHPPWARRGGYGMSEGKCAVVTAASSGIGKGIARVLVSSGYRVLIASSSDRIYSAAREIDPSGRDVMPLRADLRKREDVRGGIVAKAAQWSGHVDAWW
ncbi:SDR family NAD(P)-dependent oxidoreductase [Thermogymnomonas acidicola]|uniref:SDR family NAD(P)-dependent oxidoreductase n=1 Tax=Thermogymnomonas acidicola TaxID=399579 RepID=UPI001396BF41|nr:SDR family NAD(P)-dependent oxidoreductase [Thermogymnomonas acidicola]